jgi:hypothetical protein
MGALADGGFLQEPPARPFRHAVHRVLPCRECHGTGERHRAARSWTAADCAACHHDPARDLACASCHEAAELPPAGSVPVTLSLSVRGSATVRALPFDHATHVAKPCQACHNPPAGAAARTECAACHTDHHRPEAECALCHRITAPVAHGLEAHLTCTGAGCHARIDATPVEAGGATRPPLSRTLCLLCHAEQKDHEPTGSCHVCHRIPESTS